MQIVEVRKNTMKQMEIQCKDPQINNTHLCNKEKKFNPTFVSHKDQKVVLLFNSLLINILLPLIFFKDVE